MPSYLDQCLAYKAKEGWKQKGVSKNTKEAFCHPNKKRLQKLSLNELHKFHMEIFLDIYEGYSKKDMVNGIYGMVGADRMARLVGNNPSVATALRVGARFNAIADYAELAKSRKEVLSKLSRKDLDIYGVGLNIKDAKKKSRADLEKAIPKKIRSRKIKALAITAGVIGGLGAGIAIATKKSNR